MKLKNPKPLYRVESCDSTGAKKCNAAEQDGWAETQKRNDRVNQLLATLLSLLGLPDEDAVLWLLEVTMAHFEIVSIVGRGTWGKVMLVKHKRTGKLYAMKTMSKKDIVARNRVAYTLRERRLLQMVQHPFLTSLHYRWSTVPTASSFREGLRAEF